MAISGYYLAMVHPSPALVSIPWSNKLASALEAVAHQVGILDGRVSKSLVADAWRRQAAWSGYARALQLQGQEIDEADVFSWGSGAPIPHRGARSTLDDPFADFAGWWKALHADGHHWQEQLPFTPTLAADHIEAPIVLRMLEIVRQFALADRGAKPWLWLPILLHRIGFTATPLPCLTGGEKAFRHGTRDPSAVLARLLGALEGAAAHGLQILDRIEQDRARAIVAAAALRRPAPVLRLSACLLHTPVVSPERLAQSLGLTLSGAGKLLERAAQLGLVRELSGRRSWRVYATPAVAISLGLAPAPRGRPGHAPKTDAPQDKVADLVATFDREIAAFNARFPHLAATVPADADSDI